MSCELPSCISGFWKSLILSRKEGKGYLHLKSYSRESDVQLHFFCGLSKCSDYTGRADV